MRIAESFIDWMIANGANQDDRDVYIYGIECFVNAFTADAIMLLIGYMTNRLPAAILWIIFFTIVRTQVGGYHATTHLRCLLASTALGSVCIFAYPLLSPYKLLIFLLSLLSLLIIIKIAPVIHKNHPVSERRIKPIRWRAIAGGAVELALITLFLFIYADLSGIIFLALFSATILGFIGYLFTYKTPASDPHKSPDGTTDHTP